MDDNIIEIECFEIKQPIGVFYVGKMNYQDLFDIAYSDIRRIEKEEDNEYESYFGIQRKLSQNRIKEISEYVKNIDATFPSSILIAIKSMNIEDEDYISRVSYDTESKKLRIIRDQKIAHIIDGQHRVFGLKHAVENQNLFSSPLNFELIVTIFIDMDIDDQAMIFSTINKAHTKVNKSLVYDLFDLAKTRSPQRSAHNIARLLNEKNGSPFKDKIKMLGFADDASKETITQATLVELTLKYISRNPMRDRDYLKRGKKLDLVTGEENLNYFFRNWFILGKDENIAKVLWNYFLAVKQRWPQAWDDKSRILSKSTGVIALMKLLKDIIKKLGTERIILHDDFLTILKKVKITDDDFINDNYKAGGVGQAALYKKMKEDCIS